MAEIAKMSPSQLKGFGTEASTVVRKLLTMSIIGLPTEDAKSITPRDESFMRSSKVALNIAHSLSTAPMALKT
jgi:hypothetical protein